MRVPTKSFLHFKQALLLLYISYHRRFGRYSHAYVGCDLYYLYFIDRTDVKSAIGDWSSDGAEKDDDDELDDNIEREHRRFADPLPSNHGG